MAIGHFLVELLNNVIKVPEFVFSDDFFTFVPILLSAAIIIGLIKRVVGLG